MANIENLQEKARSLQAQGQMDAAEKIHWEIVELNAAALGSWQFLSARAAGRKDYQAAAQAIQNYLKIDTLSAQAWQGLGINLMHTKQFTEALDAFKEAVTLQPGNPTNLLYLAAAAHQLNNIQLTTDCLSLALQQTPTASLEGLADKAEPVLAAILRAAPTLLEDHIKKLTLVAGPLTGHLKGAHWRMHEKAAPAWAKPDQKPERFFLPNLPAQPWFDDKDIPWIKDIEAAYDDIKLEANAALPMASGRPYIGSHMAENPQWETLAGNEDWSAVHLYNGGKPDPEIVAKFPKTLKALEKLPLCRVGEDPIEIFFSLLAPGAHIVPHYGTSNGRLTVHMPITLEAGSCSLRAGDETRLMKAGKILAFDDSFDHEARNSGNSLRINLIFETWHPALTSKEQNQLSAMSEAYDAWFSGRSHRLEFLGLSLSAAAEADYYVIEAQKVANKTRSWAADGQAAHLLSQALEINPHHKKALSLMVDVAFGAGDNAKGLGYLRRLGALMPNHASIQYRLANVEEQIGDAQGTRTAYLRCLHADPTNMMSYLYAGYFFEQHAANSEDKNATLDIAAQLYSMGQDISNHLTNLHSGASANPETRRRSASADALLAKTTARLHADAVGKRGGCIKNALWPQNYLGTVPYRDPAQKPHVFYIPEIRPIRFMDRADMKWANTVEAAFDDIKSELMAVLDSDKPFGRPYLDANMHLGSAFDPIKGTMNWVALDLFRDGIANEEMLSKFPKTRTALKAAPLASFGNDPFEVFFSLLKPHQHIPPHFGLSNHGITVHLPMIVPENCKIRVDQEWRRWREGELIAFDDAFDHEAINESDQLRVVLIFEVWHPDLSKAEQNAIKRTFNARDMWLQSRRLPVCDNN